MKLLSRCKRSMDYYSAAALIWWLKMRIYGKLKFKKESLSWDVW